MTLTDLQTEARLKTQTDSTSYTNAQINQRLDIHNRRVVNFIDQLDQGYFETTSQANLVASSSQATRTYTLPTDMLRLVKVQAQLDGTNWVDINEVKKGEIRVSIETETDITNNFTNTDPYFVIVGNSILILSGTISAVTNGIRYHYVQRQALLASASSANSTPQFSQEYHDILAIGAAMDYFWDRGEMDKADRLYREYNRLMGEMARTLARRSTPFLMDFKPAEGQDWFS